MNICKNINNTAQRILKTIKEGSVIPSFISYL